MLYDQIQRKGKSIESCESSTTSNEMVYIYAPVIVSYPFVFFFFSFFFMTIKYRLILTEPRQLLPTN